MLFYTCSFIISLVLLSVFVINEYILIPEVCLHCLLAQVSLEASCSGEGAEQYQGAVPDSTELDASLDFSVEAARRLPPCLLMSSLPDLTVPWCVCLHTECSFGVTRLFSIHFDANFCRGAAAGMLGNR